jgi:hypothetical protein
LAAAVAHQRGAQSGGSGEQHQGQHQTCVRGNSARDMLV